MIYGSGFDTYLENNRVMIGSYKCTVLTASNSEIKCIPGENPIGTYGLTLSVVNKGFASLASNFVVSFTLTASSLNPSSSGTGGNYED